ncbi:MAG: methyltransferase domain-containing protein [Anaerolineae bacterium]|nr:methyltransferase domain-containing protein [Anaerolineae bacterium]
MDLLALIHRKSIPQPWEEGEKIPWNDPEFSQRMLSEHLSQAHDAASRRFDIIDRQVQWIHANVLQRQPTHILDLGCGPGLYSQRLAELGHTCTGIDFSPASIAYAQAQAAEAAASAGAETGLSCRYILGDIRTTDYGRPDDNWGEGYGMAMLIFGEFNVFHPDDARTILKKAHAALAPGGILLLEPHTFDMVKELGHQSPTWYTTPSGLFSDQPHLALQESFWDEERRVATDRFYIVEATPDAFTACSIHGAASSMQAYTNEEYISLLGSCGFGAVTIYPSMGQGTGVLQRGLMVLQARRY